VKNHYIARIVVAASLSGLGMVSVVSTVGATTGGSRIAYSSLAINPTPANLPSEGPEAYAFAQMGNEVNVAASYNGRSINTVALELSSWACQSGSWVAGTCVSAAGSTFLQPITLNIYNPPATSSNTPGALIASVTQTFSVPYRPSSTPDQCNGDTQQWYDATTHTCYHGVLATVVFHLPGVSLPSTFVYGVSYNTTHFGPNPIGESAACYTTSQGCPYDSLNIALSTDDLGHADNNVTVGTDTNSGTLWQNSSIASEYCDGGAAGTGTFRLDSPNTACWSQVGSGAPYYVPAIEFLTGSF